MTYVQAYGEWLGDNSKARRPFIDMWDRNAPIRGARESDVGKRLCDQNNILLYF